MAVPAVTPMLHPLVITAPGGKVGQEWHREGRTPQPCSSASNMADLQGRQNWLKAVMCSCLTLCEHGARFTKEIPACMRN